MQSYQNISKTGYHFTMEQFKDNRLVEKLSANRIVWDSLKQKWTLHEWKIKKIDTLFNVPDNPSTTFQTTGAPKLGKDVASGTNLDTALVIHPKEFESDYRKYDGMTLNELSSYIRTLKDRGAAGVEFYEVEKYTRFASPVTIFILVFMGVIVSARKNRGGTGLQIALGFVLSFVFILFFTLFRTFAENGSMPPEISVWIPNVIFGLIALAMYKYLPR
jgi:lipopolysaccharide export system permease protein